MNSEDILALRMQNQQLTQTKITDPVSLVRWFGAVQSQDYPNAKWALGQRLPGSVDADIEKAVNDGKILRTHVMRPTWHFVAAEDIRWMLELTAPRVNATCNSYYNKLGLDNSVFSKAEAVLKKVLKGGKHFTRSEIKSALANADIEIEGMKWMFIVLRAELDGVLCSGAMQGKQITYALLEERAPTAKKMSMDQALAELTKRYFTSHGPATIQDFVWWSGLRVTDAKKGLEMNKQFTHEIVNGKTFWFLPSKIPHHKTNAYLLPNYDEYVISYKDRRELFTEPTKTIHKLDRVMFNHSIVADGKIVGSWRRQLKKNSVALEMNIIYPLEKDKLKLIDDVLDRYSEFIGMPVKKV